MIRTHSSNRPCNLRDRKFALITMPRARAFAQIGWAHDKRQRTVSLVWLLVCVAGFNAVPAFAQGIITTVAGNGSRGFSGDGGPAVSAQLNLKNFTGGVAADAAGNLYIADTRNNRIRKIGPNGIISTVAGNGVAGFSGDGGLANSASLFGPTGLGSDASGNLYIVDTGNQRIRRVGPEGIITTVAGNGGRGFSGDGGLATSASLSLGRFLYLDQAGYPTSTAVDGDGNLYIADTDNGRVRKVSPAGIISTAVTGLRSPYAVAADTLGNLFITDSSHDQVLKVTPSGIVTAIAGGLSSPSGVAVDRSGNVYIADSHTHRIRKVEPNGATTIVAGSGDPIFDPVEGYYFVGGYSGDGGPATSAQLNFPWGVAVDPNGNIYIADSVNNRIRKVSAVSAGDQRTFTNPTAISIPDHPNLAQPYPSTITVSGLSGAVSRVTVTLYGVTYTGTESGPDDIDILLVGPGGRSIILMSDCCHAAHFSDVLTFDDAAPSQLPALGQDTTIRGAYKPTNYGLADFFPEPAGAYPTSDDTAPLASAFNGINPNGTWSLYAVDDNFTFFDLPARINGGWSLTVTTQATPIPSFNLIDDAEFFVSQNYFDFLNREPDQGGFAYWTNQLAQCVNDARCIHERRIGISAAFFVEQEFQETGYFIYRLQQASFGSGPTFAQFTADRAQVVDGPNLEAGKQALAEDWVERAAFKNTYQVTMSADEFVNKLFDTAGLRPFTAERQQLASDMRSGKSRSRVLRDVIEVAEFKSREYNAAFVLTEYFGYLRRDPDQAGYDFWLDLLNNREQNNYRGMVCAFITSAEYQLRFGITLTRSNADCAQ